MHFFIETSMDTSMLLPSRAKCSSSHGLLLRYFGAKFAIQIMDVNIARCMGMGQHMDYCFHKGGIQVLVAKFAICGSNHKGQCG